MRTAILLLLLIACDNGTKPAPATGSGSATGSAAGSAAAPVAPACDPDGTYRLRFASNGTVDWALVIKVDAKKGQVVKGAEVITLTPGPIDVAVSASCEITLSKETKAAGKLALKFSVDAKGAVKGTFTRTEGIDEQSPATTPIWGVRDVGPPKLPACVHPGVFHLSYEAAAKWKLHGRPFDGRKKDSCSELAGMAGQTLRIDVLGDVLTVDGTDPLAPYDQGFERGTVKRTGECTFTLTYKGEDWQIEDGALTLDGDKLTGTAKGHLRMFEDGEAGENTWTCDASVAHVIGDRVAN